MPIPPFDPGAPVRSRGLKGSISRDGGYRTTGRSSDGANSMGPVSQEHSASAAQRCGVPLPGRRHAVSCEGGRIRRRESRVLEASPDRSVACPTRASGLGCGVDGVGVTVTDRSGTSTWVEWTDGRLRPEARTRCFRGRRAAVGAGRWACGRDGVTCARTTIRSRVLTFVDRGVVRTAFSRESWHRDAPGERPARRSEVAARVSALTIHGHNCRRMVNSPGIEVVHGP